MKNKNSKTYRRRRWSLGNLFEKVLWDWLWLVCLIIIGAAIRFYNLGSTSLWKDEIFSLIRSSQPLTSILAEELPFGLRMPLHHIFIHIALFFGKAEFNVRLPSVLFGVLSIVLIYKLGEIIFNDKKVGLISAVILTFSPLHIEYSREARYYSFLIFFSLFSLIFFYKMIFEKKRHWLILFFLATALNITTHVAGFLFLSAQLIFLFVMGLPSLLKIWQHRGNHLALHFANRVFGLKLAIKIISISLAIVVLISSARSIEHLLRAVDFGLAMPPNEFLTYLLRSMSGDSIYLATISLFFFLVGSIIIFYQRKKEFFLLALLLFFPLLILYFMRPTMFGFNIRYLIFIRIPYILLISLGIISLLRFKFGLMMGVILFVILSAGPIQDLYETEKGDWRGVGEYLKNNARAGDVVFTETLTNKELLGYYYDSKTFETVLLGEVESLENIKIYPFRRFFHQHDYVKEGKPDVDETPVIDLEEIIPFEPTSKISPMYLFVSRPIWFWQEAEGNPILASGWEISESNSRLYRATDKPEAKIDFKVIIPENGNYDLYANLFWNGIRGLLKYKIDNTEWSEGFQPLWGEPGSVFSSRWSEQRLGSQDLTKGEHIVTFLNLPAAEGTLQTIDYFYFTLNKR